MKVVAGKYPEEYNIGKWVKGNLIGLNKVFLRRLAAMARDKNQVITFGEGKRDSARQQYFWDKDLAEHGGKPSGFVAKPGTSWHEFGLAVDINSIWWKSYSDKNWVPFTRSKQDLNKYGLMLPLNRIDSPNTIEDWHVQPVESSGISSDQRKYFLQEDDVAYTEQDSEKARKASLVVNALINNKDTTNPDFWLEVFKGNKDAPQDWWKQLVFNILNVK